MREIFLFSHIISPTSAVILIRKAFLLPFALNYSAPNCADRYLHQLQNKKKCAVDTLNPPYNRIWTRGSTNPISVLILPFVLFQCNSYFNVNLIEIFCFSRKNVHDQMSCKIFNTKITECFFFCPGAICCVQSFFTKLYSVCPENDSSWERPWLHQQKN